MPKVPYKPVIRVEEDIRIPNPEDRVPPIEEVISSTNRALEKWKKVEDLIDEKYKDWSIPCPSGNDTLRSIVAQLDPEGSTVDGIPGAKITYKAYKKALKAQHAAYAMVDPWALEEQLTGDPIHDASIIEAALDTNALLYLQEE